MNEAALRFGEQSDRGLGLMIGISAALHVVAVVALLLFPELLQSEREPVASYTVDLVAPNRIGGSNLPGKKRPPARAVQPPAPPQAQPLPPPPPAPEAPVAKVEAPAPPPMPEVKVEAPKPPPPKPEPKKVESKPPPKPEPKKAEPPKDAVSLKKNEKPVKKVEPPKKAEPPKQAEAKTKPKEEPKVPPKAEKAAAKSEAAAVVPEVSADEAKENREKIAAQLREAQLQEAINRAKTKSETEPADFGGSSDGPLSIGPAEGAGGTQRSAEAILYEMTLFSRAKQNWVWPGAEKNLQVELKFGIADNGEVFDVQVTQSSGDANYDASAVRAVNGLSPLPPPPETIREQFREVILTFVPDASS